MGETIPKPAQQPSCVCLMNNETIKNLVLSIKHPAGKEFVLSIIKQVKDEIITKHTTTHTQSVKPERKRQQTILEEVVDCIVAQNPYKKKFGLCIAERHIKPELFNPFCNVLENYKHLSTLSLVRCNFENDLCGEYLGKMVKINTCITSLNLSQSIISEKSLESFFEGLKTNETIQDLFLDNINMSNDTAASFAKIVLTSKIQKIRTIDLSYNKIGPAGLEAISNSLTINIHHSDLRLKGNPISREQLTKFEELLTRNKCVSNALSAVLNNAFTTINVAIRVRQTTAMMSRPRPDLTAAGDNPRGRTRTRGGTIDASSVPTHLLTASCAEEVMEDCGDSKSIRYKIGVSHTKGRRKDMQDATLIQGCFDGKENYDLFCVFDGHGTQEPATYAAKNLPEILKSNFSKEKDIVSSLYDSFITINQQMKPFAVHCGTTAVVCLIKDHILYTANVGDSRAVLCRNSKAVRLTVDHKPDLAGETERIEHMGGFVKNNRVQGALAVTRALGDWFAGHFVSPEPYITVTHLNKDDEFLLIACDGLFDVFSDDVVVEKIRGMEDPKAAAIKLKEEAFNAGSTDNISVVVIRLGDNHNIPPAPEHEPIVEKGLWVLDVSEDSEGSSSAVEVESESTEPGEESHLGNDEKKIVAEVVADKISPMDTIHALSDKETNGKATPCMSDESLQIEFDSSGDDVDVPSV